MTIEKESNGHPNGGALTNSGSTRRTSLTKADLVVFDFDETVIDCNSDTFIGVLGQSDKSGLKAVYDSFYDDRDWTVCMRNVFAFLHRLGVREVDYRKCLTKMPLVESMKFLFDRLYEHRIGHPGPDGHQYEVIIISDANTFFIDVAVQQHGLSQVIRKVITNPTTIDPNTGCLNIEPYHHQNWCKLSGKNLCKGHVLKEYIANRAADGVKFERVSYVGDGSNDLCPSLRLSANDLVFPRNGYPLHKLVAEKVNTKEIKAKMCPFSTGADIWNVLNNHNNNNNNNS